MRRARPPCPPPLPQLALLALRFKHSLVAALVAYHCLGPEDINWLYIEDAVEPDRPRYRVRHTVRMRGQGSGGCMVWWACGPAT